MKNNYNDDILETIESKNGKYLFCESWYGNYIQLLTDTHCDIVAKFETAGDPGLNKFYAMLFWKALKR